jgi:multidrug transporter EmrE-like cation transporter
MVLWIRVISNMELSRAYPSVGLSYCLVFISSVVIFKETVNLNKIVGLISILFGVYFLHR